MNYFKKDDLISLIEDHANLIDIKITEDSSALVSEYGGRLLGLFPTDNVPNLLWVNPNIVSVIKNNDWDIGGDRYWISPEREYFYTNPDKWEGWHCQKALDPANYEILGHKKNSCTLSTPLIIKNYHAGYFIQGEITRQFTVKEEPIETGLDTYCCIEVVDDCVLYRPDIKANGWSLACVICGGMQNPGTVLIPTKANPKPISYFRQIPLDRLRIGPDHVSFKIDANDVYKLAIRPEDIDFKKPAKIGYFLKLSDNNEHGFLVKLSNDIPRVQEDCFDISRDHPEAEIGVIQSYNSETPANSPLRFGEIELQLNKFQSIDNASHGKAIHQIIAYIGSKDDILDVMKLYLGISNPLLF